MEDRLEKIFYISRKEKFREYSKENLLYKCNREIYLVNTFINTLYIYSSSKVSYGAFSLKDTPRPQGEGEWRSRVARARQGEWVSSK